MRGLIIRQPWIGLILDGKKTWEIRSRATKVRGRIALIQGGSGTIVGTAEVTGCEGPFSLDELIRHQSRHAVPPADLEAFLSRYRGRAFAWVLADARPLPTPRPYSHPPGAVIWVDLGGIEL